MSSTPNHPRAARSKRLDHTWFSNNRFRPGPDTGSKFVGKGVGTPRTSGKIFHKFQMVTRTCGSCRLRQSLFAMVRCPTHQHLFAGGLAQGQNLQSNILLHSCALLNPLTAFKIDLAFLPKMQTDFGAAPLPGLTLLARSAASLPGGRVLCVRRLRISSWQVGCVGEWCAHRASSGQWGCCSVRQ